MGEEPWDANVKEGLGSVSVSRKVAAFIECIQSRNFQNEVAGGVESTLTAILGRTAAYSGREVTWDEIVKSDARWDAKVDLSVYG